MIDHKYLLNSVGAIFGTITLGYVISLMGLKRAILLLTIPEAAFWVFVYFGNHYYYIFAARVVMGYAGGGISEFSYILTS